MGAPTYYWRRNGVTVMDGGPFLGAQTATLYVNPVSLGTAGAYDAVCINQCGYISTTSVTLTIICPADFDGSGVVQVADIFAYLNTWFAGDIAADTNADGHLAVQDIFDFLNVWFAGC
jgi:hypothetical protein